MEWANVLGLICNILSLLILLHNFYRYTIDEIKKDKHELDDRELLEQINSRVSLIIQQLSPIRQKLLNEPPPSPSSSNSS